jgi:hypothetical protein
VGDFALQTTNITPDANNRLRHAFDLVIESRKGSVRIVLSSAGMSSSRFQTISREISTMPAL